MANTVLSTLYSITTSKEEELAKQRDACRSLKRSLLDPLEHEDNPRQRIKLLLKDAGQRQESKAEKTSGRRRRRRNQLEQKIVSSQHKELLELSGISPANLQRFIEQSAGDASISAPIFKAWEDKLRAGLQAQEIKYEYAKLFSSIVNERAAEGTEPEDSSMPDADAPTEAFEQVGRPEMHAQRKEWEKLVFEPNNVDEGSVKTALEATFSSPEAKVAVDAMRKQMEAFGHQLQTTLRLDIDAVKQCVRGLLASDILSDDQATALRQMSENTTYLSELADVLNLRLNSLDKWSWGPEPVACEMRRQLNGKYRVYMQEEITTALLLYFIGVRWAMSFRESAIDLRRSSGWQRYSAESGADKAKWDYFIGGRTGNGSINASLLDTYDDNYFMELLPSEMAETTGYGDDALHKEESQKKNAFQLKQRVLHLLTADSVLADRLGEELVTLQTDFRWFGPSLSHSALYATLRFFGVTDHWLTFFRKFLEAPLRFTQDGPSGPVRTRRRGIPMSHILSDFFGETMLFAMDFAVNSATTGKPMFRLHDDVWFWGTGRECVAAWQALTSLATSLGIEINTDKTGAARILSRDAASAPSPLPTTSTPLPAELPKGPLKWGFLHVPSPAGSWTIDQALVDTHIAELRRQLAATKSILSWARAYNTYARFLLGSFCAPANCLGRAHVDDCLATLARVHAELLPDGDVGTYVKGRIEAKFGIACQNVPDGFIYFPWEAGGLGVLNPFVSLLGLRAVVDEDPAERVDEAREDEEVEYNRVLERFRKDGPADRTALDTATAAAKKPLPAQDDKNDVGFLSREEYGRVRRERSWCFWTQWLSLSTQVEEENVEMTAEIAQLIEKLPADSRGEIKEWGYMKPYWRSVCELYGPEMGKVFGGLAVVERGLLPMGLLDLFRGKVRWLG